MMHGGATRQTDGDIGAGPARRGEVNWVVVVQWCLYLYAVSGR